MNQRRHSKTIFLVRIGVFGALSFVVMLLEFYIGFAEYLKLDFSDIIAMVGGITMGPLAAAAIQLIKNLLKVLIISRTAGIGELANLLVGIAYVVPASYLFHKLKKKDSSLKGLIIGLVAGSFTMVIIACLANFFILLPLYWNFLSQEAMTNTAKWTYITIVSLPFNIIKALIISVLTLILHTSMKPIYKYLL